MNQLNALSNRVEYCAFRHIAIVAAAAADEHCDG
jgi:hypothetical protein